MGRKFSHVGKEKGPRDCSRADQEVCLIILSRGVSSRLARLVKNFISSTILVVDNLYLYEDGRYAPFVERGDLAGLKDALNKNGDFWKVAVDLLSVAVIEQKLDVVEWLLEQGVDPNDSDPYDDGCSALWWVVLGRNWDLIRLLVKHGATVRSNVDSDQTDDTPLHQAADTGDDELVTFLVNEAKGRAAFEIFDVCDWSPLHSAINSGHLTTAKLLLDFGHDPNALVQVLHDDRIGCSPISLATRLGNAEMTALLLTYGADPDRPGWMWITARDQLDDLEEPALSKLSKLLEVPPLKKLKDSHHIAEVERQLLADLSHHGFPNLNLSWKGSKVIGTTIQVGGDRLARFSNIRLCDQRDEVIGRGEFGFLVLTVELEFRVFWSELKIEGEKITPGNGTIPGHVWHALSEEQRSWLIMDSRNEYNAEQPGLMLVDGEAVR